MITGILSLMDVAKLWTRILNNVCIKKLNPVFFVDNYTEYVIALGGGWQEGEFFLITVTDGIVNSTGPLRAEKQSVCQFLKVGCSILWVVYSTNDDKFFLLVKEDGTDRHFIVEYRKDEYFMQIYEVPQFIPQDPSERGFVMLLGKEAYSNKTLIPRGLALNPFSKIFYIWGNAILQR
ncbi:cation channel sperm-associated protein subunit gamma 1-like [Sceloporus undulatus]|uniref:cation channel sperm-associated protein subunit gamma 1-like n=1 Tax=Sceloporus undulatus TaxID=8520 RepID=UPI001C4C9E20|nr:cation channel sperm-associated protein subunit gamma 1-like [Sceloporus undulatus]